MKKSVFFAIICGLLLGSIFSQYGYHVNTWKFWILAISFNAILNITYSKCKD